MSIEDVKAFYNESVEHEWGRMDRHPFEFAINKAYMDRYIKPGDRVLDIGGGPGRYSLYLAQRGCDVTLVDLSEGNVKFALEKAKELGLPLKGICANACELTQSISGEYDHVLMMGPLYHLIELEDRRKAIQEALAVLKRGGTFYAAFIQLIGGLIYYGARMVEGVLDEQDQTFLEALVAGESYGGPAFTEAYFAQRKDAEALLAEFPLEKLHMVASEGVCAPFEPQLLEAAEEVRAKWLEISLQVCEQEQYLGMCEHLLYVGRKR